MSISASFFSTLALALTKFVPPQIICFLLSAMKKWIHLLNHITKCKPTLDAFVHDIIWIQKYFSTLFNLAYLLSYVTDTMYIYLGQCRKCKDLSWISMINDQNLIEFIFCQSYLWSSAKPQVLIVCLSHKFLMAKMDLICLICFLKVSKIFLKVFCNYLSSFLSCLKSTIVINTSNSNSIGFMYKHELKRFFLRIWSSVSSLYDFI